MKRLFLILSVFLTSLPAVADSIATVAPLDSVAYAIGYKYTATIQADETGPLRNETDRREFIRGLEDHLFDSAQTADSSYMTSYCVGGMIGIFMTDGHHGDNEHECFRYMAEGLRRVAEGRISLPADTLEAVKVLSRHAAEDRETEDLAPAELREFFVSFGIMKPFQRGLQEYIDEMAPGRHSTLRREALAAGMADILDAFSLGQAASAYDSGKSVAMSANLLQMSRLPLSAPSYLAGARTALGLSGPLIDVGELDRLALYPGPDSTVVDERAEDKKMEERMAYANALSVVFDEPYAVDWKVTARPVIPDDSPAADYFGDLLQQFDLEASKTEGRLMAQAPDDNGILRDSLRTALGAMSLPDGFAWFCETNYDHWLVFGIMPSEPAFRGKAAEASVGYDAATDRFVMPWTFRTEDTATWERFTAENVGLDVIIEINGMPIFVPHIATPITDGRCVATGLHPETINRLFFASTLIVSPADDLLPEPDAVPVNPVTPDVEP